MGLRHQKLKKKQFKNKFFTFLNGTARPTT